MKKLFFALSMFLSVGLTYSADEQNSKETSRLDTREPGAPEVVTVNDFSLLDYYIRSGLHTIDAPLEGNDDAPNTEAPQINASAQANNS